MYGCCAHAVIVLKSWGFLERRHQTLILRPTLLFFEAGRDMTLKDLLRKKETFRAAENTVPSHHGGLAPPPDKVSRITFMRTTTNTAEQISPPTYPGDDEKPPRLLTPGRQDGEQKRLSIFRRPSQMVPDGRAGARNDKRLSERLHLSRPHANSSLVNLPSNLPAITVDVARSTEEQAEWEQRATALAKGTLISKGDGVGRETMRSPSPSVSDEPGDVCAVPFASYGH